jgi:hypothetical protein
MAYRLFLAALVCGVALVPIVATAGEHRSRAVRAIPFSLDDEHRGYELYRLSFFLLIAYHRF